MSNHFSYIWLSLELGILVWQDFMFGCGQVGYSFSTRAVMSIQENQVSGL
jgi:hypothetical protein